MDHSVLIQGESGTGKEIVARQIHALSGRRAETFVPVNCGGIPTELFESELFGHMLGSFTGAARAKKGLWTLADKGVLFLDEIGDLPLHHQIKVLRALEDGCYYAVGAESVTCSKARVIAATNRDLAEMVSNGRFREDLFYRLFTFRIRTPALREHRGDIPQLALHFWESIGERSTPPLTHAVLDALSEYRWPGNARELRSFLINLLLLANGRKIDVPLVRAVMRERLGTALSRGKDS
jgi:transcriptional regulator with PAS, ATPase and Fis domain